jgi:hypothetical protein
MSIYSNEKHKEINLINNCIKFSEDENNGINLVHIESLQYGLSDNEREECGKIGRGSYILNSFIFDYYKTNKGKLGDKPFFYSLQDAASIPYIKGVDTDDKKYNISLSGYKLLEKNHTFYEKHGFLRLNNYVALNNVDDNIEYLNIYNDIFELRKTLRNETLEFYSNDLLEKIKEEIRKNIYQKKNLEQIFGYTNDLEKFYNWEKNSLEYLLKNYVDKNFNDETLKNEVITNIFKTLDSDHENLKYYIDYFENYINSFVDKYHIYERYNISDIIKMGELSTNVHGVSVMYFAESKRSDIIEEYFNILDLIISKILMELLMIDCIVNNKINLFRKKIESQTPTTYYYETYAKFGFTVYINLLRGINDQTDESVIKQILQFKIDFFYNYGINLVNDKLFDLLCTEKENLKTVYNIMFKSQEIKIPTAGGGYKNDSNNFIKRKALEEYKTFYNYIIVPKNSKYNNYYNKMINFIVDDYKLTTENKIFINKKEKKYKLKIVKKIFNKNSKKTVKKSNDGKYNKSKNSKTDGNNKSKKGKSKKGKSKKGKSKKGKTNGNNKHKKKSELRLHSQSQRQSIQVV